MAEEKAVVAKNGEQRLRHWDPFELLGDLEEQMTRRWGEFWPFAPYSLRRWLPEGMQPTAWAPRADVYEQDGFLVVKAELPGVQKEDVAITLEEGDLVIRGERKVEHEVKEDAYYRMERSTGTFYRRLPLPGEVKPEDVQATFTDGVLEVRLPKPAEAKPEPQKIAVA